MQPAMVPRASGQDAEVVPGPGPNSVLNPVVGITDRDATRLDGTHPQHLTVIVVGGVVLLLAVLLVRRPFLRRRSSLSTRLERSAPPGG